MTGIGPSCSPKILIPEDKFALPMDTIRVIMRDLTVADGSGLGGTRYSDLIFRLAADGIIGDGDYEYQNRNDLWSALADANYSLVKLAADFHLVGAHTAAAVLKAALTKIILSGSRVEFDPAQNPRRLIRGTHGCLPAGIIETIENDLAERVADSYCSKYYLLVLRLVDAKVCPDLVSHLHGEFQIRDSTWLCLERVTFTLSSLIEHFEKVGALAAGAALRTALGLPPAKILPSSSASQIQAEIQEQQIRLVQLKAERERTEKEIRSLSQQRAAVPPKDEAADDNEKGVCCICLDRPSGVVFLECGHLACCKTCAGPLSSCPMCRRVITRKVEVFQ